MPRLRNPKLVVSTLLIGLLFGIRHISEGCKFRHLRRHVAGAAGWDEISRGQGEAWTKSRLTEKEIVEAVREVV